MTRIIVIGSQPGPRYARGGAGAAALAVCVGMLARAAEEVSDSLASPLPLERTRGLESKSAHPSQLGTIRNTGGVALPTTELLQRMLAGDVKGGRVPEALRVGQDQ